MIDQITGSPKMLQEKKRVDAIFGHGSAAPIQRKLAGALEKINDSYLDRFSDEFVALKKFKNRQTVLAALKDAADVMSSDEDLKKHIPGVLTRLGLDKVEELPREPIAKPLEKTVENPVEKPVSLESPAILSVSPSKHLPAVRLAPTLDRERGAAVTDPVLALYEKGLLLVTGVQRKDLYKMHIAKATAGVAGHIAGGQISMPKGDEANTGKPLEHAKVNWTLTSPRMRPHYFKMIIDDDDRRPKPESASEITDPRIATLADPTAMGRRFMRGKTGAADLSDWMQDQSSSKTAGVADKAPLFDFGDPVVRERFDAIRLAQEGGYLATNPEINTFGFPPDAIVGFLVTSDHEKNTAALQDAKRAMSEDQQGRLFPVFTWRSTGATTWTLVLVGHI